MLTNHAPMKPRMRKRGAVWICYCGWARGEGSTPKFAYAMWKIERVEWAVFAAVYSLPRWRC